MSDSLTVDVPKVMNMLGLDLDQFKSVIENVKKAETDEQFFTALSAIAIAKKVVGDALEVVESYETQAKGLINAKAKALYGNDWQVIKGERFKISRSSTGSLYEVIDPDIVEADFVSVKISPNAKTIDTFREVHDNKLPEGVAINEHRGESIRITVK